MRNPGQAAGIVEIATRLVVRDAVEDMGSRSTFNGHGWPASWDDDIMEMQPCEALVSEDVE